VLALLSLRANQVVSRRHIADRLWGERLPNTADNLVQGYVSRLRAALRKADAAHADNWLMTRASGYLLNLQADELDLLEFEQLAAAGERLLHAGDPAEAAELLRRALRLWNGPALAGLPLSAIGQVEAVALEEKRLAALEQRIDADLACGQCDTVIGAVLPGTHRPRSLTVPAGDP
jgi:DNA-binding SARP family transcriptional activator